MSALDTDCRLACRFHPARAPFFFLETADTDEAPTEIYSYKEKQLIIEKIEMHLSNTLVAFFVAGLVPLTFAQSIDPNSVDEATKGEIVPYGK